MKKLIFPIIFLLASCTQIQTQAEQKPSEYWMTNEYVSNVGTNDDIIRSENKEAICYSISGTRSSGISCFKK